MWDYFPHHKKVMRDFFPRQATILAQFGKPWFFLHQNEAFRKLCATAVVAFARRTGLCLDQRQGNDKTMREICYHVAVTLDGYIARRDGSIKGFPTEGDHNDDYLQALKDYDTVIMGRRTYEFGYDYGLKPGARAYDHMAHWIFSRTIDVPPADGVHIVRDHWLETIDELREQPGTAIYLCGGSVFAGWLLAEDRIDRLKLKLNPVLFGEGLPLFADGCAVTAPFRLISTKQYESGVMLLEYERG